MFQEHCHKNGCVVIHRWVVWLLHLIFITLLLFWNFVDRFFLISYLLTLSKSFYLECFVFAMFCDLVITTLERCKTYYYIIIDLNLSGQRATVRKSKMNKFCNASLRLTPWSRLPWSSPASGKASASSALHLEYGPRYIILLVNHLIIAVIHSLLNFQLVATVLHLI